MKHLAVTLLLILAVPASALACPICFRVEEGAVTDGVQAAVLVLVGITSGVLSGFGWFIAGFIRRSRQL